MSNCLGLPSLANEAPLQADTTELHRKYPENVKYIGPGLLAIYCGFFFFYLLKNQKVKYQFTTTLQFREAQ